MAKKKVAKKKKVASAPPKAPTKTQVLTNIAETTGLSRKEVAAVFDALQVEIKRSLAPRGPGVFTIPGVVKIAKKKRAASPAKKGVMVAGRLCDIKAKPARTTVGVRPLKALKDMVGTTKRK